MGSAAASRAASSTSLRPASARPASPGPRRPGHGPGPFRLVQRGPAPSPPGRTAKPSRVALREPLGQRLQATDSRSCFWFSSASAPGASVSASSSGHGGRTVIVVTAALLGRPLQGQVRVDPAMFGCTGDTVFVRLAAVSLPEPNQDLLGESALLLIARGRAGFPRGRRLGCLEQRDGQASLVSGLDAGESVSLLANERILRPGNSPSRRNRP